MSEASHPWYSLVYGVLLHPTAPCLLLVPRDEGWSLPHVRLEERVWPRQVSGVSALLRAALGTSISIVRYAGLQVVEETTRPHLHLTYVVEGRDPLGEPPCGGRWVGREGLSTLMLSSPRQQAIIEGCLAEAEGGPIPALRPAWQQRGWFRAAATWMAEQLAGLGRPLIGPVEQVKLQGVSCILRGPTAQGNVYFKVASALPLFADEPALTEALAGLYPHHVAAPLARHPRRRWMLLPDLGAPLGKTPEGALWTGWLQAFGQMQRRSAGQIAELLALGCLDRRLHRLAAQIDPLLDDAAALAALEDGEIAQLRALRPRLKEMCARLASYAVPATLVHGDLHPGNIAARGGAYLFFDWTDGCVAHPFVDLVTVRDAAEYALGGPEAWGSLLESYLALWTDFEPMARLREVWALAEPLGYLHDAISYQHIVASLEPASKAEMDGVPFLLRRLLELLPR